MLYLLKKNPTKVKIYKKVRYHCHFTGKCRGAAHSMFNLKFNMPNEVPVVFYNGSDYDYYVIIKNWMSWAKYKKVLFFFHFNRKRSYKYW